MIFLSLSSISLTNLNAKSFTSVKQIAGINETRLAQVSPISKSSRFLEVRDFTTKHNRGLKNLFYCRNLPSCCRSSCFFSWLSAPTWVAGIFPENKTYKNKCSFVVQTSCRISGILKPKRRKPDTEFSKRPLSLWKDCCHQTSIIRQCSFHATSCFESPTQETQQGLNTNKAT